MNEMGVSSHKGKYLGHLKLSCLHIPWQLAGVSFCVRRVRFKIYNVHYYSVNSDAIIILLKVM